MNTEVKRLYRSRTERMIGGVCGGLAKFLNIDVSLVRLLFVLGAFLGGPGLLVYLVMLFVVPEEPLPGNEAIAPVEEIKE
jgi:phage shock protein C